MARWHTPHRLAVSLWRRRDGVSALEFGFVAPILLLFVIGAFEVGNLMYANAVLEGAAREAARRGVTGFAPCNMTRQEYIEQVIDQQMIGFANPDRRTISIMVYDAFSNIGEPEPFTDNPDFPNGRYDPGEEFTDINGNLQWDPDMGAAGLGGPGAVVAYKVSYDVSLLTGFFTETLKLPSRMTMTATAAIRNEPIPVNPDGSLAVACDI
ncbi:MAG: TadE/TadG family type IV pilus assembly protein [Pseudomonadota bacterium]